MPVRRRELPCVPTAQQCDLGLLPQVLLRNHQSNVTRPARGTVDQGLRDPRSGQGGMPTGPAALNWALAFTRAVIFVDFSVVSQHWAHFLRHLRVHHRASLLTRM